MTCIVGLVSKKDNCIYLGGDSAGASEFDIRIRKDPKVFTKEGFGFGFTTSFRMGQLLMCTPLKLQAQKSEESNYEYIVNTVIPRIKEIFKDGGFLVFGKNGDKGGTFLLTYKSSLYEIQEDFQVAEYFDKYTACGCGQSYALGSLYSTDDNISDLRRVHIALEAAEYFNGGVRKPFNIIKIDNGN